MYAIKAVINTPKAHHVITDRNPLPQYDIPQDAQIIAIGDVHGQADALAALLEEIERMPATKPRHLIFLGDIIDRGPANIEAMRLVGQAAEITGAAETTMLLGNHEMMLLDALNVSDIKMAMGTFWQWARNGGDAVLDELGIDYTRLTTPEALSEAQAILRAALPEAYAAHLAAGPSHVKTGDITFVHAGIDPTADPGTWFRPFRIAKQDAPGWAWIREDFLRYDGHNSWGPHWGRTLVVHGHTPAIYARNVEFADTLAANLDLAHSHGRICLDAGAANRPRVAAAIFDEGGVRVLATQV